MFWGSRQSLELISHSVKILIHPALNYIDISFCFPIKRYETLVDTATLLLLLCIIIKAWLNHEFGVFWFQGETFLSSIFVKLDKQVPFHAYIHLMSFSSLSHATHFCLVTLKTCHWKWGILSQTVFALFYRFTMTPSKGFRMPPFNHVHVLSETVS